MTAAQLPTASSSATSTPTSPNTTSGYVNATRPRGQNSYAKGCGVLASCCFVVQELLSPFGTVTQISLQTNEHGLSRVRERACVSRIND